MSLLRILPIALLLSLASMALPAQPRASTPWQVDWGQYYCSMIRQSGEGRPYATAFLTTPGEDSSEIMLVPERHGSFPRGISSVTLIPRGSTFQVRSWSQRRGTSNVLRISGLAYDFRDELAGATELQLKAGDEIRARIPLDNPRQAIAAHRRCTADISREWGVDETVLAALQKRPASTNALGLSTDDYPHSALRTASQGRVIVRVDVSAEGRAVDCATVATSGNSEIDATTCRVIVERARFDPAIDAAGRRVAVRMIATVTWIIPGVR